MIRIENSLLGDISLGGNWESKRLYLHKNRCETSLGMTCNGSLSTYSINYVDEFKRSMAKTFRVSVDRMCVAYYGLLNGWRIEKNGSRVI